MRDEVANKWLEMTNLVLGGLLACGAIIFADLPVAAWNAGVVGLLIALCSATALYRYSPWQEWSNITLGCWSAAAPFLLGFGTQPVTMWTHVTIGLCVATLAIIQLAIGNGRRGKMSTRS
jgi:hypothetical protein